MLFYQSTTKVTKPTVRLVQHKRGEIEVQYLLWLPVKIQGQSELHETLFFFSENESSKQNIFIFNPIRK